MSWIRSYTDLGDNPTRQLEINGTLFCGILHLRLIRNIWSPYICSFYIAFRSRSYHCYYPNANIFCGQSRFKIKKKASKGYLICTYKQILMKMHSVKDAHQLAYVYKCGFSHYWFQVLKDICMSTNPDEHSGSNFSPNPRT